MRVLLILLVCMGCASTQEDFTPVVLPDAGFERTSPFTRALPQEIQKPEPKAFDLTELYARVDESPELIALQEDMVKQTGAMIQGDFMPDPVLNFETRMMPVDDPRFSKALNRVMVSQRFEIGNKAASRVDLAKAARKEAMAAYFVKRTQMMQKLASDYSKALFALKKAGIVKKQIQLKKELHAKAQTLVSSGRLPERDLIAYAMAVQKSAAEEVKYQGQARSLIRSMEGILGLASGAISELKETIPPLQPLDHKKAREEILTQNSELILLDRKLGKAQADLELKKSGIYPDITVGLGYARGQVGGHPDDIIEGKLEIPLPLINRNQGAIHSAEAEIRKTKHEIQAAANRLLDTWASLKEQWEYSADQKKLYEEEIIPLLKKDLELMTLKQEAGRQPIQVQLKAALELENAMMIVLNLEESSFLTRIEMVYLQGACL